MVKLGLIFIIGVLAFWLSAICGGGASLLLIPLLTFVLPSSLIPFTLTIGTTASSVSRIAVFRKNIKWNIFFWFVPFSIPSVLLGAWALKFVNPLYLQLLVAFILLLNVFELFKSKKKMIQSEKKYPSYVLGIVGFFAGFVSGITGAIGLLFNRFYLKYGLSKEEIIATRAANEITLHLIKLCIYIALGLYSHYAFVLGLIVALAAVCSSISVKYILPFISEFVFKKVGYGAMVLAGFILMITTATQIVKEDDFSLSYDSTVSETHLNWRDSKFAIEFEYDEGFEIELQIKYEELPMNLQVEYNQIISEYDKIIIEKVFAYGEKDAYEFYCYKGKEVLVIEF